MLGEDDLPTLGRLPVTGGIAEGPVVATARLSENAVVVVEELSHFWVFFTFLAEAFQGTLYNLWFRINAQSTCVSTFCGRLLHPGVAVLQIFLPQLEADLITGLSDLDQYATHLYYF